MSDLIDRQAAIDALAENMPSLTTPDGCGQFDHDIQVTDEAYVDCMQIIHELPSAQPGWIPCSTALPELDGTYLVTKKFFGWNCKEYIEIDIARYEKKNGWHKADQVVAWMPLPTPYREGGQDGTD